MAFSKGEKGICKGDIMTKDCGDFYKNQYKAMLRNSVQALLFIREKIREQAESKQDSNQEKFNATN
jgi:hypothetical protein